MVIYSGDSAYTMLIHFWMKIFFHLIFYHFFPYLNVHIVSSVTVSQAVILTTTTSCQKKVAQQNLKEKKETK